MEIEEIEESGSDMDKDFNEAEEIFVWDDKRKKYKKPKKKASVNVARSSKVGPIGGNGCQVYSAMKKWYFTFLYLFNFYDTYILLESYS